VSTTVWLDVLHTVTAAEASLSRATDDNAKQQQQQPTALACANAAASIADAVETLSTINSTSNSSTSNTISSSSQFEFQTAWLTLRQELLQLLSFTHVACQVS
jgi:hypothetical protein